MTASMVLPAAVPSGWYRTASSHLVILAAAISPPVAAGILMMSQRLSPVTVARTTRLLDVLEGLLVVTVVLLAAADLGLSEWALALAGQAMADQ